MRAIEKGVGRSIKQNQRNIFIIEYFNFQALSFPNKITDRIRIVQINKQKINPFHSKTDFPVIYIASK